MNRQLKFVLLVALPLWCGAGALAVLAQGDLLAGVLTAAIGVTIVLMVVSIFSQPGAAKLSPQRAAAIAAGRADRRTVFETPGLRQVMWLLLSAAHSLNVPRLKAWIRQKLVAAGNPNYYTPDEYLALSLLTGVGLGVVLAAVNFLLVGGLSIVALVLGVLFGAGGSLYQLHNRSVARLRLIVKRIPYGLDLIALAMGAGATFTEAVRTIVEEAGQEDPFRVELRTMLAEMELGTTRRQALQNLAGRVPLDSLRNIVASVIQAEELGTPLGDVLHDQATLMRVQRSTRAENRAAIASVRILIPCLLLVMAVILAVFGPAILRAVRKGLF